MTPAEALARALQAFDWDANEGWDDGARAFLAALAAAGFVVVPADRLAELEDIETRYDTAQSEAEDRRFD